MLEFDARSFVILLVNFLCLFFILNAILFKPMAKLFKERESATTGALDQARQMAVQKDEALSRMSADIQTAKLKAKEAHNSLREEGLNSQKDVLSSAEAKAMEIVENARKELKAETDKARASLRADIDRFSEEIVSKLVKA
ncbi:MAG: ATP synthase F0 subunit B [Nitrospirales bacterium]|nr:ATP synthase F0 subunit B [Nitrospirales bacterium]